MIRADPLRRRVLYRHNLLYQALLREALSIVAGERDYGDEKLVREARLSCSKSTLYRFRTGSLIPSSMTAAQALASIDGRTEAGTTSMLNATDSRRLWDFLRSKKAIDRALTDRRLALPEASDGITKGDLYSEREVASGLSAFYGCHESQVIAAKNDGIEGEYFCLKRSFRKNDFFVKSLFTITSVEDEYVHIDEEQRSSGFYEADGQPVDESSTGFGLYKSERLWIFARERDCEQPRVFCFYEKKPSIVKLGQPSSGKRQLQVTTYYGNLIEGSKRFIDGAFMFPCLLISADADRRIWEQRHPNVVYNKQYHIDIFPLDRQQVNEDGKRKDSAVPEEYLEYIKAGKIIR
jgi:hypothetical protein